MPADPGDLFQSGADGMGTIHADSVMLGSTINDGDRHKRAAEKNVPTTAAALTTFLTTAGLTSTMVTRALTTYKIASAATAPAVAAAYAKIRSDTCITCPQLHRQCPQHLDSNGCF